MAMKIMEGQMDFLGLINEYTDDQGATVRVREGRSTLKPAKNAENVETKVKAVSEEKMPEKAQKKANGPRQISIFDFDAMEPDTNGSKPIEKPGVIDNPKPVEKPMPSEESTVIEEPKPVKKLKTIAEPKAVAEPKPVEKPKAVAEPKPVEKPKAIETSEDNSDKELTTDKVKPDMLFKQCTRCWCYDCKHNARNEGVPRDMCGTMMPCPACKGCEDEDMATVCVIGSAKEGCMLRAVEEGIFVAGAM